MSTPTSGLPDDILSRVQRLDDQAFSLLFTHYYASLVSFATRYVRERTLAEDVVNEVFARLWEIRAEWNPTTTIRAYLFGAVRNRALNATRQRENIGHLDEILSRVEHTGNNEWPDSPDSALLRVEASQILRQAIRDLSERDRLILRLRWQEQLGWEEIASILEMSVGAVQMRHTRTLRLLQTRLQQYF